MANPNNIPLGCPYEHTFIRFMEQDIKRPCLKEPGHKGNHVVVEPNEEKLLEVWQKGTNHA
jgi:hypothetical protein